MKGILGIIVIFATSSGAHCGELAQAPALIDTASSISHSRNFGPPKDPDYNCKYWQLHDPDKYRKYCTKSAEPEQL